MRLKATTRTIQGDLYTPTGTYLRLRDLCPMSALMECSDYHDEQNSRSFIGIYPIAKVSVSHGKAICQMPYGEEVERKIDDTFGLNDAVNTVAKGVQVEGDELGVCGLYGYTSFNAVAYTENINIKDEVRQVSDAPDVLYVMYRDIIVFDHHNSTITLVSIQEDGEQQTERHLQEIIHILNRPCPPICAFRQTGDISSPLSDEEHKANIRRGIAHCLRGDVFQIVLSRRFAQHFEGDDFNLYRSLRTINPSPYLFYFDMGGFRIFGSSPETHCRIEGGKAYIDPIAGTTRRTGDEEADRRNAEYLRKDEKENAEHVMLVDLARNDLSRHCHGVKVEFYKDLQYYSHVIHLVSRVSGVLDGGADPVKAFFDTFPAGTLSGAPKVRAMQLISQYEPHNRGAYGGCIGFIGLNGSLNQAITIRTFVARQGELWFQAGGGIVALSNEEYELQEVNNKLGALRKALFAAEKI